MKNRIELIAVFYNYYEKNNYMTIIYDNLRDISIAFNDAMQPEASSLLDLYDIIHELKKQICIEYINPDYIESLINELNNYYSLDRKEADLLKALENIKKYGL